MPPEAFPLVDVADIIRLVGKASFDRARVYARNGAVSALRWDDDVGVLSASVQGTEPRPYQCDVELVPAKYGFSRPVDSSCTCPMDWNCKHVAAALLSSNAARITEANSAVRSTAATPSVSTGSTSAAALPAWKTAVSRLTEPPAADAPAQRITGFVSPTSGYRTPAPLPPVPMSLQFEVREETPRTQERWRGPTARTATVTTPASGVYRLGVRPVMLSPKGTWVRGGLTWNNLTYGVNRLNLNPDHHRWFCQLAALHRATPQVYAGQDPDWLYLDDFSSPLLWPLLDDAVRLGISFVGGKKDATVLIGREAAISLDVRATGGAAEQGAEGGPANDGAEGSGLLLTTTLTIDDHLHPPENAGAIADHGVYGYQLTPPAAFVLAPTASPLTDEQRTLLGRPSGVVVPAPDVVEFLADYYPKLRQAIPVTSTDASVQFPATVPPVLVLTATFQPKHILSLTWNWEYNDRGTPARLPLQATPDDQPSRDAIAERPIRERAAAAVRPDLLQPDVTLREFEAAEFAETVLPGIEQLDGIRVDIVGTRPDYRELTDEPQFTIKTVETDQRDWFDLGVIVRIDGRDIPFGPLFAAMSKGKSKLLLVDGSYLSLNQPAFEQLHLLIEEARALAEWDTGLRISRFQASLWADFEDLAEETEQAEAWRTAVAGLNDIGGLESTIAPTPVPAGILAELRPYQRDGFTWLAFLWQHGLGGILADDMGLGKTLQTLALLVHAKDRAGAGNNNELSARRPFLVVAPTSVVSNWVTEAGRFAPGLTVAAITATQAKSCVPVADAAADVDIVVTSYALFRLDFDAYQDHGWAGLILDEAQFVKNRASRAHLCARDLDVPFKLAITGTPMENNLMELWSLFSIVAPGLFPSARKFTEDYVRVIEAADDPRSGEVLARLRRRIRPLMMRRTKELVASDLPAKQEQVLQIDLEPRHKKLYETFLQRERQKLLGLLDDMDKNRFIVFRSLTLLRMLSLDASLLDEKYADVPSSKLDALFEQLEDVLAEGHRALIFSQFTSFLGKAAARLDALGTPYCYLDGSTVNRATVIDRFKTGTAPIFLISLKAGGFGLNLTEADYVFLLDPWWNPATEAQAVDRTHRIGQTRNVMVYRMVATGTIEEKVMALKEKKAKLFSSVMDDDAVFSSALTADDIRGLLDA
jgi:superfamily II DNA or RNA helicase